MNIKDICTKKNNRETLNKDEIEFVINGYLNGSIDEEKEMTLFIKSLFDNGMNDSEIFDLTEVMVSSGDIIDLSDVPGVKIDKHSTGGIGDKTTIALAPLVASCGVIVPKMSGRSLGFTGGTIDKLESIPGFNVNLDNEAFYKQIKEIKVGIVAQTGNLVPADKKIYALRDKTGMIESIPLIASSIMSKKLASGADKIVIDLKIGDDAFMKTFEDAHELGNLMVKIGNAHGKETICVITDMHQPLGNAIGNALEVHECIQLLKGEGPQDLKELVVTLGALMVAIAKDITYDEAFDEIKLNLNNGNALLKLEDMIRYQGGDINNIPISERMVSIKSPVTGFINEINAAKLGTLARKLGAVRIKKEDVLDHSVGFILKKKIGDYVMKDEELIRVYMNHTDLTINEIIECFEFAETTTNRKPLIYEIIK